MAREPIHVAFLLPGGLSPEMVDELVDTSFAFGVSTQADGSTETCSYIGELTEYDWAEVPLADALSEFKNAKNGAIKVWYKEMDILLDIRHDSSEVAEMPSIGISIDQVYFGTHDSMSEQQRNVQALLELTEFLTEFTDAPYVCGYESEHDEVRFPLDLTVADLQAGRIDELFWLTLFNPAAVERFGRDRLLSAPAWRVEELDSGAILVVLTDDPRLGGNVRIAQKTVEEHLGLR